MAGTDGEAGASALEVARRQREKADELARRAANHARVAESYEQGAAGEVLTAALIADLVAHDYYVLHDLRIPGSVANIDHVVVGPTGVFVIDSKNFGGDVTFNKETLWSGRHAQSSDIKDLRHAAQIVEASVALPKSLSVTPVMCIHRARVQVDAEVIPGVVILAGERLRAFLVAGPAVLSSATCELIAEQARATLGRQAKSTPASAPTDVARAPRPRRAPGPRRQASGRRSQPARRVQQRSGRRESLGGAVLGLVVAIIAVFTVPKLILASIKPSSAAGPTTTAPANAAVATPSRPTAPPPDGSFSCAVPGEGWRFAYSWPGVVPGLQEYLVDTHDASGAVSPTVSWSDSTTANGLFHLRPSRTFTVRLRSVVSGVESLPSERSFTSPATPC